VDSTVTMHNMLQSSAKKVIEKYNQHQLGERLNLLTQYPTVTPEDIEEIKRRNTVLTKILMKANQHCKPLSMTLWSLAVQKAYLKHQYWTLCCTALQTKCNLKSSIEAIAVHLYPTVLQDRPMASRSSHLHQAQKEFKKAQREAALLQKQHLKNILNQALAVNQKKKSKAITYLIRPSKTDNVMQDSDNIQSPRHKEDFLSWLPMLMALCNPF